MAQFVRKRIVNDLIDEIVEIDAVSLEFVGHRILEIIEGTPLIHRGVNKDHKPVGYTLDTYSHDFKVVGEYSTEDKYFIGVKAADESIQFEKIGNDLTHVLEHCAGRIPERIYLVSSEEQPASFRVKFNTTQLAKDYSERIRFLSARDLAEQIFDASVSNANHADFFCQYFPDFGQNLDNYEYFGRVPPACADFKAEEIFFRQIREHFAAGHQICVLHGLSGAGKTQAAINYVRKTLDEYENYIWISGEDWKPDVALSAIKRVRGGVAINVAGIFNASKTLLIVDDLTRALQPSQLEAELAAGFGRGGRVLVTSQIGATGKEEARICVPIERVSHKTAFQILDESEATATDACRRFVEECRFSPLILSIVRNLSDEDDISKEDLYREVLENPVEAQQADGTSILSLMLGKLSPENRNALVKIANGGCRTYEIKFLNSFIGTMTRAALQRLAILSRTATSSTVSVHELICRAVRTAEDDGVLATAIEQYVSRSHGEMVPSMLRQIHLAVAQLKAANHRRGNRPPDWLTYALMQVDPAKHIAPSLQATSVTGDMPMAQLLCVVDAKEGYAYTLAQEDRGAYYERCAEEYGQALEFASDPDVRAELMHHQGKAFRRCAKPELALDCFKRLLAEKPDWHAAHGQVAHLGTQKGVSQTMVAEGEVANGYLIDCTFDSPEKVPLRVSLAAISRLRSYFKLSNEIKDDAAKVQQLADVVALSALEGFDQFYEAFLALTSLYGYHHGGICLALAEAFPEMLTIRPDSVEARQWSNACEGLTNVAVAARAAGKKALANELNEAACSFADEVSRGDRLTSYLARVVAKTYIEANRASDALAAIDKVPQDRVDHWVLYQKTRAELAMGTPKLAIESAKLALALVEQDKKAQGRRNIYHVQQSQCWEALGEIEKAVASMAAACELTADPKYREQLESQLQKLTAKLP
ncbi:ATP-binding protein [Pseudomonas sp. URMO17WK12:I12]|jgi:hypothetical protein|uniref:ATP-binding protein n=1 Tax=Pseudomonas sp. URMO17WK12:I12 TaxID=1259797 RepID=UPI000480CEEE|nr:ATP-binding protein [Pseudomonas sp. URMO17WK12:I12]